MNNLDITLLVIVAGFIANALAGRALTAYRLKLRSRNIAAQGWPPVHLDADGEPAGFEDEEQ